MGIKLQRQLFSHTNIADVKVLKENCNAKTSWFHLKGRSKSCKMRPKSLKSAKPFSRFSALKIEIWTILQGKRQKNRKCCFFRSIAKLKNNCVTSEMINAQFNNNQSRIFPSVELIRALNFMNEWFDTSEIRL